MNNLDTKIKYPITKDQLQKGFNIVNEIIINEKKQFLEKYVQDFIEIISVEIVKRTINEELYKQLKFKKNKNININDNQKFKFNFLEIGQRAGNFSHALNENFRNYVSAFWQQQKIHIQYQNCSYSILPQFLNNTIQNPTMNHISELEIDEIKLKIFEGLKERFPDCLIQIDPLKTYIIIDWN